MHVCACERPALAFWAFSNTYCTKHSIQVAKIRPHTVTESDTAMLCSTLISPLTFMRKCDAVGFRLLLGLLNIVFLSQQTNGMPWEAFGVSQPALNLH